MGTIIKNSVILSFNSLFLALDAVFIVFVFSQRAVGQIVSRKGAKIAKFK